MSKSCGACGAQDAELHCMNCGELSEIKSKDSIKRDTHAPENLTGWKELRNVAQRLLTIDDKWVYDKSGSMKWWPSPFMTEMKDVYKYSTDDGVERMMVSVRTEIGRVDDTFEDRTALLSMLHKWNVGRPGGAAYLLNDILYINHSNIFSPIAIHTWRYLVSAAAFQASYAIQLAANLITIPGFTASTPPHPLSGYRSDFDELATLYIKDPKVSFDVINYLDDDVLKAYRQIMEQQPDMEIGWSNTEAVYYQRKSRPEIAVGMGIIAAAENHLGLAGVRFAGTLYIPVNSEKPGAVFELVNAIHKILIEASEIHGLPVEHSTTPFVVEIDGSMYINIESFLPAEAMADYNSRFFSAETRAGVIAHYALSVLRQVEYVRSLADQAIEPAQQ